MASKGRKKTYRVDLSDVESLVRVPDGSYHVKVAGWEEGKGDAGTYIKWELEIMDGDEAGSTLSDITSLSTAALWRLRAFLDGLQAEIPDEAFDLDPDEYIDMEMNVEVINEPDNRGTTRSRVADYQPFEDEKPARSAKASTKRDTKEDDKPARSAKRDEKPAARGAKASAAAKSKAKEEPPPLTQDDLNDMSQDELDDVIKEHDLDVDLTKFRTLNKMRAAVIDAAESAGVFSE